MADHADAAPTRTPPPATNVHALFTSRTPDPRFPPSPTATTDEGEEENRRRRRRNGGERPTTLKIASLDCSTGEGIRETLKRAGFI
jgi:hypothetical protein